MMRMHLTRLRVEQVRRFRQPMELSGLTPGLNIVTGPNEAGKSTLVRALRAAFLERNRSTALEDLRPWGEGSSAPTIEVDFELAGVSHRLVKSFLARKRCSLRMGATTLDSAAAEDHLAQLFGFSFASKGASKPEHAGIPGLLWVEQGTGHLLEVGPAQDHLREALSGLSATDQALHELTASGGDALLERLQQQRAELLTPGGKPRGEWAVVSERLPVLRAQGQELEGRIQRYRAQVDELGRLRLDHETDARDKPWETWRADLERAQAELEALTRQGERLRQDQDRLQRSEQTRELLAQDLQHQVRQAELAVQREREWQDASAQLAAQAPMLAQAHDMLAQAQAATARARAQANASRLSAQRLTLDQQLQDARAGARRAQALLERVQQAQAALQALVETSPGAEWPAAEIERLRQLDRAEREARFQRQAVATRLHHQLVPGVALTWIEGAEGAEAPLSGEGEVLLDARSVLDLPGLGRLTITPGGGDLAERIRHHERAGDALRAALQGLGVASLDDAERRHAAQLEHAAQVRSARQALRLLAPQGIDPLRAEWAQAQDRCAEGLRRMEQLPVVTDPDLPVLSLAQAEAADEAAQDRERAARQALGVAERAEARWRSALDIAERERRLASAAEVQAQRDARRVQSQRLLLEAQTECEVLREQVRQAESVISAARPDWIRQDIERLQASVNQRLQAHQRRHEQILQLQAALAEAGAEGLEESLASVVGERARSELRQGELSRRAQALDLLCRLIEARRQAALDRLHAPLLERMSHYLPLLWPQSRVELGASLQPGRRVSRTPDGGLEAGDIDALSFGTREQMALISRLAYADLLQQAGRPTLLVLDDVLVHSDAQRLSQMKRVLYDASRRHQILLFTCQPAAWSDMGVELRTLAGP